MTSGSATGKDEGLTPGTEKLPDVDASENLSCENTTIERSYLSKCIIHENLMDRGIRTIHLPAE